MNKPKRSKVELTIENKREISLFEQENPKMKKIELIRYFSTKFKHIIPGSTIHDILKKKEKYINGHVNKFRARESKYPELEDAFFLWFCDKRAMGVPISDEILLNKAKNDKTCTFTEQVTSNLEELLGRLRNGYYDEDIEKINYFKSRLTNLRELSLKQTNLDSFFIK
ncbi:unnamed protein product [Brachionus calyciflorus]|uniref:HTH CENPB-type domain-containing protein n=1 Tax=Brachionus calyciflorus TaxID=104777 RepID=A0A813PRJ0_9BILA|nr:unnamed protein product [Brachionus calyciflorus]